MSTPAQGSTGAGRSATQCAISVRIAEAVHRRYVMSLVPRLVSLGLAPWRDPRKMLAAYVQVLGCILHAPRSGAAVLIAEDSAGVPLGFSLLVPATDCHTRERFGQVVQIIVADDQHQADVESALIASSQAWAQARGYRVLTLNDFWAVHPAAAIPLKPESSMLVQNRPARSPHG